MRCIAFTLIGGHAWFGGYNYQVNLIQALLTYQKDCIRPILFLGTDEKQDIVTRFENIAGLTIVQSKIFNKDRKVSRLLKSLLWGRDTEALDLFVEHKIDVVFEVANFYGWRFPLKTIAWVPDLQHQHLRHLFNFFAYWKREIGFRMQIMSGRNIMLSSEDARKDFLAFYSIVPDKVYTVRFAVPANKPIEDLSATVEKYELPRHFFYIPNQFWRHKNYECVLHALQIIKNKGEKVFVIASGSQVDHRDSNYYPMIENMVEKFGLESYFKTLGVIPYQDVQALMQASLAIVNPSKFEGWSTSVEEAKSLGVKMILSDLSVHIEQAREKATYFSLSSSDQLADILINFRPTSEKTKITIREDARSQAEIRLNTFASEFTNLVNII